ncbi:MAG: FG-GAP-like repeat-containing protein, partial [bacterium]
MLKKLFMFLIFFIVACNQLIWGQSAIQLDHVDGTNSSGQIVSETPIKFYFRLINQTGYNIGGFTNGFKVYSPDGATWQPIIGDTTSIGWLTNYMDGGILIYGFSVNGSDADTIGFGGFKIFKPGIPNGFNDIVWWINTQLDDSQVGKTLCLDSTFYPPGGAWVWSTTGGTFQPQWNGPHCYDIVQSNQVVSVIPVQNLLNIISSINIKAIFENDINPSTLNSSTFIVHGSQSGLHSGAISYDDITYTATFDPDVDFFPGEVVTVTLTDGIESTEGVSLSPYSWQFTIEAVQGSLTFDIRDDYDAGDSTHYISTGDYDNDGDLDLVVANLYDDHLSLYTNNGLGKFTIDQNIPTDTGQWCALLDDIDNDGDLD